jgi:hypothetical protein
METAIVSHELPPIYECITVSYTFTFAGAFIYLHALKTLSGFTLNFLLIFSDVVEILFIKLPCRLFGVLSSWLSITRFAEDQNDYSKIPHEYGAIQ